jgi:adenylate cyclase
MLTVMGGYWYIRDLKSRNGIRVNGNRVYERRLDPGDELSIAQHRYQVRYSPSEIGAIGPPPATNTSTSCRTGICRWNDTCGNLLRRLNLAAILTFL